MTITITATMPLAVYSSRFCKMKKHFQAEQYYSMSREQQKDVKFHLRQYQFNEILSISHNFFFKDSIQQIY